MDQGFCHLHVHDEYSLLDGYGSAEKYAKRAKEIGFKYLALTNHGNIDGLIKFQQACDKYEISPILGCELFIVPDASKKEKGEKRGHVTVLIENETGYQNLCKMLTKANLDGMYYRPRVGFDDFFDCSVGLIILTGCAVSFLTLPGGEALFDDLVCASPNDIFLEVMPHDFEDQRKVNSLAISLFEKYDIPFVATNDCHYIDKDDWEVQEVLMAIRTQAKWNDPDRFKFGVKGLYLRDENEMFDAFVKQGILDDGEINEALDSTLMIAQRCSDFRIKKQDIYLPKVPAYKDKDQDWIYNLAVDNLHDSLSIPQEDFQKYVDRLNEEWSLINEKGFVAYFEIVHELINWCKDNGIMTGPGRGSVGGSLLAYLIGITKVDPIKYNLLFSRFIAPNRLDYPDIDIDFEDRKRDQVRQHLEELYGKKNVSGISTFLTMKGRAAVRDVSRVFDVPLNEADEFAKVIESASQAGTDEGIIEDAINNTPEGKYFADKYPKVVHMAIKLEGQIRGGGQHAAGVIISADDLTEGTRGNLVKRKDVVVSNWDMPDSEYVGLMKLDVLGLNTLSILNEAKRLIEKNEKRKIFYHPESECYFAQDIDKRSTFLEFECTEVPLEFEKIPLDDPTVYKELAAGNTVGVFQMNTWAGTKLSKEMGTNDFQCIVDNLALVRPGPANSGMTQEYVERHWGKEWERKSHTYEHITKNTYGLIVYQEQIMQVIHEIAGLPYETADKIRKVIGKKRDAKEFAPYKEAFVKGCKETGYFSPEDAEWFWEMLQEHASYSFNLSHSVEYAMIAYWTAWVKQYFPAEFICASLTYGADNKKKELIDEAKRLGLKIVLPKVGISDSEKWMVEDGSLYAPFIEIKGLGEKTAVQAANMKPISQDGVKGFFSGKVKKKPGKVETILEDVGAFGNPPVRNVHDYFSFDLSGIDSVEAKTTSKLLQIVGDRDIDMKSLQTLDFRGCDRMGLIKRVSFRNDLLADCKECSLKDECEYGPVLPSKGKYNLAIIGEAPGGNEDKEGEGFVGKSGDLLWGELAKYDMTRDLFHVSNMVKCYPKIIRTPSKSHIAACKHWLDEELSMIECRLILAFGNTCMKGFVGRESGIRDKSGTTEWVESIGAWVCWAIHPSAVLHNFTEKSLFDAGIKNFVTKIEALGGI